MAGHRFFRLRFGATVVVPPRCGVVDLADPCICGSVIGETGEFGDRIVDRSGPIDEFDDESPKPGLL